DRGFDVVTIGDAVADVADQPLPAARIAERTSWSCHHGVARWTAECADAADGRWKGPLRAAFERLAGAIDAISAAAFRELPGEADADRARDEWIDVVAGAVDAGAFADGRWPGASAAARETALALLEAQRWRLAMFASDGWF